MSLTSPGFSTKYVPREPSIAVTAYGSSINISNANGLCFLLSIEDAAKVMKEIGDCIEEARKNKIRGLQHEIENLKQKIAISQQKIDRDKKTLELLLTQTSQT